MKRMLCIFLLCSFSAIAAPNDPAALIDQELTKLIALYTDGLASNDARSRHVTFGSLFDDPKRQDAVAFFSLQGVSLSNVHQEYIAIFAKGQGRDLSGAKGPTERPYHLVATAMVGSRGSRSLDWKTARITKGQIVVQGKRWAQADAQCCPTKPIVVTFSIAASLEDDLMPESYPVLRESETP